MEKVNLIEKFGKFQDHWKPRIAGEVNDSLVKLVKFQGEFLWHHHEQEDEMFLVVKGRMTMRFRDKDVELAENEFIVVPRGVEHMPVAGQEAWIVLFEPRTTLNTGNVTSERTVPVLDRV
jgi:mannose-6-phosphate isomerase-like protein (cupin superfamily)